MASGVTKRRTRKGPTLEQYLERIEAMDGVAFKAGSTGDNAAAPFISRVTGRALDVSVAAIASFHEFGAGVPPRPWLRITFGRQLSAIKRKARVLGVDVIKGEGAETLRAIAEDFADVARDTILSGGFLDPIAPPVSPGAPKQGPLNVRERNPSLIPLFDTGQILSSIGVEEA